MSPFAIPPLTPGNLRQILSDALTRRLNQKIAEIKLSLECCKTTSAAWDHTMSVFVGLLVSIAWQELSAWQVLGNTESDPRLLFKLRAYGAAAGLSGQELTSWANGAAADTRAWSAAFISYLFVTAGAGAQFPVSTAHSYYVTKLKANLGTSQPFQTFPVTAMPVAVGDLVCKYREDAVTYEDLDATQAKPEFFRSHCDLIVRVDGKTAVGIGGNVHGHGITVGTVNYTLHDNKTLNHPRAYAIVKNFK